MIIGNPLKNVSDYFYSIFRIFVGLLFLQHGVQKLFGLFTESGPVQLTSLMGLAGIIEFFGGILIILGLFTRLVSLITAIEMLVAYFMAHIPNGLIPIQNQGELALLYFVSFLILLTKGSKKWSLEQAIFKREIF